MRKDIDFKPSQGRLDIWINFLTKGEISHWNVVPGDVAESPSQDVSKAGGTQCHGLADGVVFSHRLDCKISEVFSKQIL